MIEYSTTQSPTYPLWRYVPTTDTNYGYNYLYGMDTSFLTESYQPETFSNYMKGIGINSLFLESYSNSKLIGFTYYWYNEALKPSEAATSDLADFQFNKSGNRYYYIAIG